MDKKVREAAERLRRYKFGDTRPYEDAANEHLVDLDDIYRDLLVIRDAYLAEHPSSCKG